MYLFQKIEEMMMRYEDARKTIGDFVLQEQKDLHKYTIGEIAEKTFTSKSTVTRFAKTLGYSGWKSFMKDFVAEQRYQMENKGEADANFPFDQGDSTELIMQKIKQVQIESIEDTYNLMDAAMVELAVKHLLNARHIVIFGLSPNIFIGELFRRKMVTIGKQIDIAKLGETGIISRTLTDQDCAIMISYSGNNEFAEPAIHLKNMLNHHVPVIGITSGGDNYIRKSLNCVLTMSSRERLYTKISNFATEESILYILNVLFSCYFALDYEQNLARKLQTSRLLEKERKATAPELAEPKKDFSL